MAWDGLRLSSSLLQLFVCVLTILSGVSLKERVVEEDNLIVLYDNGEVRSDSNTCLATLT